MNTTHRILSSMIIFVGVVFLIHHSSVAQGRQGFANRMQERIDTLKVKLALTDTQVVQVKAIYQKAQDDMQKFREENQGGDRMAMMGFMRERTEQTNKEIKAILTPEQQKKFEFVVQEMQEQQRKRMEERQRMN